MATFLFRVVSSILEPPCFNKNASLRLFQAFLVQTSLRMIKYLYLIWTSYTLLTSSVYHICNISSSLLLFGRRRSNKITWTSFAWHCRDIYIYIYMPKKNLGSNSLHWSHAKPSGQSGLPQTTHTANRNNQFVLTVLPFLFAPFCLIRSNQT